jgi:hypothetical protein
MTKKFITYRTTAGTSASLVTTRSIYRSFSGLLLVRQQPVIESGVRFIGLLMLNATFNNFSVDRGNQVFIGGGSRSTQRTTCASH